MIRYIRDLWLRLKRALTYPSTQQELQEALSHATLKFFEPGTTLPATVYMDQDLTAPHHNPVVADGSGEFPAIFIDPAKPVSGKLIDKDGRILLEMKKLSVPIRCPYCGRPFKAPDEGGQR